MFFTQRRAAKQPELVKAEQDDDGPADTRKPCLVVMEKFPHGGKTEAKEEKGETDAEDKKQSVFHDPASFISDIPLFVHRFSTAG